MNELAGWVMGCWMDGLVRLGRCACRCVGGCLMCEVMVTRANHQTTSMSIQYDREEAWPGAV